MGKGKPLCHQEIQGIIDDYLRAYGMVHGPVKAATRQVAYRKGWFFIGAIPYRPHQMEAMTIELCKRIPPRADSDHNGNPR